jgi:hypothetical protein
MVVVSCLSTLFMISYRAVKCQIVRLVCKNRDTVAVQNVSTCHLELRKLKKNLSSSKSLSENTVYKKYVSRFLHTKCYNRRFY